MSEDAAPKQGKVAEPGVAPQNVQDGEELLPQSRRENGTRFVEEDTPSRDAQNPIDNHGPLRGTLTGETTEGTVETHEGAQGEAQETTNRLSTLEIHGPAVPVNADEHLGIRGPQKVSEWSHQALAPHKEHEEDKREEEWQDMPAVGGYDVYDDEGRLVARKAKEDNLEANAYTGLGGAGKGYTRVQHDEDANSTSSMEDNTSYLFKQQNGTGEVEEDEELRDTMAQMQATKDLLTEGQRIAYVGVTRVAMAEMVAELEQIEITKDTKKELALLIEAYKMWSQKMMVRLYAHMEISSSGL